MKIASDAEVMTVTLEEAKRLPNMLGVMASASLKLKGEYTCTVDGQKVHFLLG